MNEDEVSLREHLETVIDLRFKASEDAMNLYRDETLRRLAELNQLRAEVTTDRQDFLRKEIYETKEADLIKWKDSVNKDLTTLKTRIVTWTAAVGAFVVILNLVLRYLGK